MWSGLATCVSYILFPVASVQNQLVTVAVALCLGILCYAGAHVIHTRHREDAHAAPPRSLAQWTEPADLSAECRDNDSEAEAESRTEL